MDSVVDYAIAWVYGIFSYAPTYGLFMFLPCLSSLSRPTVNKIRIQLGVFVTKKTLQT